MEHKKYNNILQTIDDLHSELSPLYDEIAKLNKALSDVNNEGDSKHPLSELIVRLTKTARRHNVSKKVEVKNSRRGTSNVTIGTNHQALGYEDDYSSQLSPLVPDRSYGDEHDNEQKIRDILFNEDAVIELTSILKKSNQKTFLKTLKILKKYKIVEAFGYFKEGNIEKIEVPLQKSDEKIVVDLSRRSQTTFNVHKDDDKIANIDIRNNTNWRPNPTQEDADDTRYNETTIEDINGLFNISQNSDAVITAVKEKTKLLKGVITGYKDERKELNELLQPILALEKL